MNINLRALALATLVFVTADKINAQNIFPANGSVGIGTTSPNASAILDISSTTKGMLAPRMTKSATRCNSNAGNRPLIFQTNGTPGLYIYSGTAWVPVSGAGANTSLSNLNATTKVNASLVPDSNKVRNLGSSGLSWKNIYYNGSIYSGNNRILNGDIVNANTSIGYYSGALNTTGAFNTASGYAALYANTSGSNNTASGNYALTTNTTGGSNTSTGAFRCTKTQQEAVMSHSASTRFIQTPAPTIIQLLVRTRFAMQQEQVAIIQQLVRLPLTPIRRALKTPV